MALIFIALSPLVVIKWRKEKWKEVRQMIRLLLFIDQLLGVYIYVLVATAVFSWLIAFNIANPRNSAVYTISKVLNSATEPLLRPLRRVIPQAGMLDFSFIALYFGILGIREVVIPNFIDWISR